MKITIQDLKRHAINTSFFPETTLTRAIEKLRFIQADPIRSPARAQDLILRQRVRNYRAGDLEQRYPKLGIEEDFLYAYGFMPLSTWRLLHPRAETALTAMEARVLEIVSEHKQIHPNELEAYLGREREINAWGGYSKATTRVLQHLHYRGLLRIARRENGIRLYEPLSRREQEMDPNERVRRLVLLLAAILAPAPERSLRAALQLAAHGTPALKGKRPEIAQLLASGELADATIDGVRYLWPAGRLNKKEPLDRVRFLAPFDPLVWDRRRFELFWNWSYRFEAYTPPAKRKLGYYALPLLWREEIVGWVIIAKRPKSLSVKAGFWQKKPSDASFRQHFDAEAERFQYFLSNSPL